MSIDDTVPRMRLSRVMTSKRVKDILDAAVAEGVATTGHVQPIDTCPTCATQIQTYDTLSTRLRHWFCLCRYWNGLIPIPPAISPPSGENISAVGSGKEVA